ncbi:hypothetical protein [Streptomyces sp. G1]|uniref:hypothetical protein n=1 Tax=Streptomyces sp. G1 TaxID=361572 RepID=UPI00202FF5F9|nr:hypothetical protein [Streptomyces sp. G1]MCM1972346.1 hypothetical protein [Streptomyces sp. G1]
MTTASNPGDNIAAEIARLRGEIQTGLEQIKGTLGVLVERTNRTDQDVRQLRTDVEKEIDDLKAEVNELKKGRWPLAQLGALVGMGGLIAAVVSLLLN